MRERIVEEIWKVAGDESVRDSAINDCADKILGIVKDGLPHKRSEEGCDCLPYEGCGCCRKDYNQALTDVIAKLEEK